MGMTLPEFLDHATRQEIQPGRWDCGLWLADWGLELTGIDGAASWRGRYKTELGFLRILKREGGIRAVVEKGALAIGMSAREIPRAGDVGVLPVITPKGPGEVGALYTGERWAVIARRGLTATKSPAVLAWGL